MKKVLLIPIMLILAACNVKPSESVETPDSAVGPTESVENEQPTAGVPEGTTADVPPDPSEYDLVTITFADYEYRQSDWQPIIDQFNLENPGITVVFVPLVQELTEGVQSSDTPERAMSADTSVVYVISSESAPYLLELQPLMDMDGDFQADDFWPAARQACSDPFGRSMGLPLELSANVIFYDKAVFDRAGLAAPQPGWTWEDFKRTIDSLSQLPETGYSFADGPFLSVLQAAIVQHISDHDGQLEPQALEAEMGWFIQLVLENEIYPAHSDDYSDTGNALYKAWQAPFQSSQPPVMWVGSLQAPYPELSIDPAGATAETSPFTHLALDRYGVAPIPVGNSVGAQNTTPATSVACAVISAGSQAPQAAWEWINHLTNYWYGKDDPLLSNQILSPSRISVADSSGYWQTLPAEAVDSVNFALSHSFNAQGGFYEKNQIVYKALDRVFAGEIALSDALLQAQAEIAALPEPVLETIQPFVVPSGGFADE
jgi:ABC-type glycerol-3-phosphate transport system substrate-binding protein